MLINRYLAKEVLYTLISLTGILLLIFMSNQFMLYLTRAASGKIPAMFIMKLMMLELPNLIGLLLPLGFYISLLIAYGRMYSENEMTVLNACGYGSTKVLKTTSIMAFFISLIVLLIMLWVSPLIAIERAKLLRNSGIQTLIQTVVPGKFRELSQGKEVFYVEKMNTSHTSANNIFLARYKDKVWELFWSDRASLYTQAKDGEDYVIFKNGRAYKGNPGNGQFELAEFKNYQVRLPHPDIAVKKDIRTAKTSSLFPINNSDKRKAAELQWRFSVPLMVLTLTLIALGLSRVNPRSGKYAKLLPAIIIYIFYANSMFIMRDWIISNKIPSYLGMWWIHVVMILLGTYLWWKNEVKV